MSYVQYCLKYINVLLKYNCRVILVFDGASLPSKRSTDSTRRERRQKAKEKGAQLLSEGKTSEAVALLQTATEITYDIVLSLIKRVRLINNVDCLVAPYESDAQLAYLLRANIAQLVVTEDSDLIVFGADRILFKMDPNGDGTLYEQESLGSCLPYGSKGHTFDRFRRICILSGCDYYPEGLPGVGLTKAAKFMAKTSSHDLRQLLPRAPRYLQMPALKVTPDAIDQMVRAENTFLYQVVFDPIGRQRIRLSHCDDEPAELSSYAGEVCPLPAAKCVQLATGVRHPHSHKLVDDYDVIKASPPGSLWHVDFRPGVTFSHSQAVDNTDKASTSALAFGITRSSSSHNNNKPMPQNNKPMPMLQVKRELSQAKAKLSHPKPVVTKSDSSSSSWTAVDIARIYGLHAMAHPTATAAAASQSDDDDDGCAAEQPSATTTTSSPYFGGKASSSSSSSAARNPFRVPRCNAAAVAPPLTVDAAETSPAAATLTAETSSPSPCSKTNLSVSPCTADQSSPPTAAAPAREAPPPIINLDDSSNEVDEVKKPPSARQPATRLSQGGQGKKRPRLSVDADAGGSQSGRVPNAAYKCPLRPTDPASTGSTALASATVAALSRFAYRPSARTLSQ